MMEQEKDGGQARMYELSLETESLPASYQQTKVVIMISEISREIESFIDTRPLSSGPAAQKQQGDSGVGGGSEQMTQTAIKDHFEANMLDGDDVKDSGGAMLSAESVLEYIQEFYHFNTPSPLLPVELKPLDEEEVFSVVKAINITFVNDRDCRYIAKAICAKYGTRPAVDTQGEK